MIIAAATGFLTGIAIATLILVAIFYISFVVSRQKIVKTMDEIEGFLDTKHSGVTRGGTAAFIMPDRVSEISKSKPGVSIDEVLV